MNIILENTGLNKPSKIFQTATMMVEIAVEMISTLVIALTALAKKETNVKV